jgi:hypothetical protein
MNTEVNMSISFHSQICLYPLSKQVENGVAIIGRGDQFLELPLAGLDFVAWLDQGLTIGQARERFEAAYNPFPDEEVKDVLQAFLACDFIAAIDNQPLETTSLALPTDHHSRLQSWAQHLFSTPLLIAWLLFVGTAAGLWLTTPALWPKRLDYFWTNHYFVIVLVGMLIWLVSMAGHELAHWLAARAKGIDATITWTYRLGFFPMSQAIMSNIWAVPRSARYLPLAAGMMWDLLGISTALYLRYFETIGWFDWPDPVVGLLKFYLLVSVMGLTAQFWLFSRMDGYFLLSSLLGQRNLQADTYDWLKSKFKRTKSFDVPAAGMKFIYIYAVITLIGGGLFLGQFLLVELPIKLQLLWQSYLKLTGQMGQSPLDLADGLGVFTSQILYWGLLVYAYWRTKKFER